MFVAIFACLAIVGWMRYFFEKESSKFFEERHLYWYNEAVELRDALLNKINRVEGDEWKDDVCH